MFIIEKKYLKLIGIIVLAFAICCLVFKLTHRSYMHFVVEFSDIPPVSDKLWLFKIDVHFRGYDVGDVTKIQLASDQSHIEFYVDIHYKNLKIPTNSFFIFKTENLYGTRYLDIQPPEKQSGAFISNGDIIDGTEAFERVDEYLIEELTSGKTGKLIDNLYEISEIAKVSLQNNDNKKFWDKSAGDLAIILEKLRKITEDPSLKLEIRSAIKHSSSSFENIDEILKKGEIRNLINQSPQSIKMTLDAINSMNGHINSVVQMMPEANKNIAKANTLITEANGNLGAINEKVPPIPPSLIENTEKLVVKTDCFESEISKLIGKKWLIPRLIFANPGKSFKVCAKRECKGRGKDAKTQRGMDAK